MISVLDLFSGGGGLALGSARAGASKIVAIDSSSVAIESLEKNSRLFLEIGCKLQSIEADIKQLSAGEIGGNFDAMIAGSPCQPFSVSGNRKGCNDFRNGFDAAIKIASELLPKVVVFENVFGFVSGRFEHYFHKILVSLAHLDRVRFDSNGKIDSQPVKKGEELYRVQWAVLNAADFGSPQIRKRVFIAAVRNDVLDSHRMLIPDPTHSKTALLRSQLVSGAYWNKHGVNMPKIFREQGLRYFGTNGEEPRLRRWRTLRDVVSDLGVPGDRKVDRWHQSRSGARIYKGHSGSILDWPSKTIKAGVHGVPGGENMIRLSEARVRYLTVRECGVLQGFSVRHKFEESLTKSMSIIGNAVPVDLAAAVLGRVFEIAMRK